MCTTEKFERLFLGHLTVERGVHRLFLSSCCVMCALRVGLYLCLLCVCMCKDSDEDEEMMEEEVEEVSKKSELILINYFWLFCPSIIMLHS